MAVPRIQRLTLSLTVVLLLASALWVLANSPPAPASADSSALFATPSGSGTACSQVAPCSLQTAAAQAQAGDVVYLAAGSYYGVDAGAVVTVTRGYTLYGGWDGAAAGPVARDPAAHRSVVDGENVRQGIHIDGTFTAGVDDLTVTSGKAEQGGGIYVRQATVLIRNNVITACQTITYSTWAFGMGAGIYLEEATGSWIANNVIANNTGGYGAGICDEFSAGPIIEANEINGNVAQERGGGLLIEDAADLIRGNRIANNYARGDGGGMLLWDTDSSVEGNRFLNNSAYAGAGLSLGNGCQASVVNNWIIQGSGDGILEGSSSPRIVNNTIVGTGASGMGTGIKLESRAGHGPPYAMVDAVLNNIVCGFDYGIVGSGAVTPTLDYNDVWNSRLGNYDLPAHLVSGAHSITADPRFVGPAGDYHLRSESPCINAGNPDGVPPAPTLDIDGDARPYDGRVDIGADEFTGLWSIFLPRVVR